MYCFIDLCFSSFNHIAFNDTYLLFVSISTFLYLVLYLQLISFFFFLITLFITLPLEIPVNQEKRASIKVPPKLPKAPVKMEITTPSGAKKNVPVQDLVNQKVAPFTLTEPGPHSIDITYGGVPVKDSPFKVEAVPDAGKPKVKAYGPGLTGGEALKPAFFTIDAREETAPGSLGVTVEGPKESPIEVKDNGDGTCGVTYMPEVPGDYKVNVTHADRPIPGSPFNAKIKPSSAPPVSGPPKVKAYGPGLTGGEATKPAFFTIDTREETRPGGLGVTVEGPKESRIDCKDNGDGTCGVSYLPEVPGDYKINVTHADKPIPGSPFTSEVKPASDGLDVSGVQCYGPGLSPDGNRLHSIVDCCMSCLLHHECC